MGCSCRKGEIYCVGFLTYDRTSLANEGFNRGHSTLTIPSSFNDRTKPSTSNLSGLLLAIRIAHNLFPGELELEIPAHPCEFFSCFFLRDSTPWEMLFSKGRRGIAEIGGTIENENTYMYYRTESQHLAYQRGTSLPILRKELL